MKNADPLEEAPRPRGPRAELGAERSRVDGVPRRDGGDESRPEAHLQRVVSEAIGRENALRSYLLRNSEVDVHPYFHPLEAQEAFTS